METGAIEHAQTTEAPIIISIKRKRGRPFKQRASIQDPASSTIQEVKRRRGRPPKKAKMSIQVESAEAIELVAAPETSGRLPPHVAVNKDDVAEPPTEAPTASTSAASTITSTAKQRSRSTPQRMTEADEPLASRAATPAACPPGASPQHAVRSPPSRSTPAAHAAGSRGTIAAHDASEPSSPPSKPLSSSASQSDRTAIASATTVAAASTPSSPVTSLSKTKRRRSTPARAVGGKARDGQGRHSRPSSAQKSARQQKVKHDTPTEEAVQLDRRAVKRVRKDQFKEENIEAYGDTVTVFCLRDFLGNKRWSKEVLELSQRSRRLLQRRDAGGGGKPQKRHARASRLRDTLHRLLQEVET